MASLKEIKIRIASVNSTLKITSAMRMISSAKLHRSQSAVKNLIPYKNALNDILIETLAGQEGIQSPYFEVREIKRVAIIAVSSNSSLCGAFNVNVEKMVKSVIEEYKNLGKDNIILFPIGKKISKALSRHYSIEKTDFKMVDKPNYTECAELASKLTELFRDNAIDRVEIVYNHFNTTANQVVTRERYLPMNSFNDVKSLPTDYILEPDRAGIIEELLDKVLTYKILAILMDSNASEHAARMVAMQLATENAKKLIQELTVQYNKSRQQAITNELLDIMGGMAH
ncbi:MAG: ATP synthase F1 subunit gamma [Bacteroidales bacterium]